MLHGMRILNKTKSKTWGPSSPLLKSRHRQNLLIRNLDVFWMYTLRRFHTPKNNVCQIIKTQKQTHFKTDSLTKCTTLLKNFLFWKWFKIFANIKNDYKCMIYFFYRTELQIIILRIKIYQKIPYKIYHFLCFH